MWYCSSYVLSDIVMIEYFASDRSFMIQSLKTVCAFTHLHMVFSIRTLRPLWNAEIACYCKQSRGYHCKQSSSSSNCFYTMVDFSGSWEWTFPGDKSLSLKPYRSNNHGRALDQCFFVWNIKGTSSVDCCHLWACLHTFSSSLKCNKCWSIPTIRTWQNTKGRKNEQDTN